jgi:hypothetical protein
MVRPKAMRIQRPPMHLLIVGYDARDNKLPPHEYTETTKTINELIDYYVEDHPTVLRITVDVAILPQSMRAGRITPI